MLGLPAWLSTLATAYCQARLGENAKVRGIARGGAAGKGGIEGSNLAAN